MPNEIKERRKEIKKFLKSSCRGVLNDLLSEVGFSEDEANLFKERYLNDHSVLMTCILIHCGNNKYNYVHNRILDKIYSHFHRIN